MKNCAKFFGIIAAAALALIVTATACGVDGDGIVILSGTVDLVVNYNLDGETGTECDRVFVQAYNGSTHVKSVLVEGNNWSMEIDPFDANTTLRFAVLCYLDTTVFHRFVDTDVTRTVRNQSISNINLGTVTPNFGSLITLSGTVEVMVNGTRQNVTLVMAYIDPANNNNLIRNGAASKENDNTWVMLVPTFANPTDLYFKVDYHDGTNWNNVKNIDGFSVSVHDTRIDGIDLGTIEITVP